MIAEVVKIPFSTHIYTFPFIILAAVLLFLFFAHVTFKFNKMVNKVASATFAVYIIHMHPNICDLLLRGRFEKFANANPAVLLGILIFVPLLIYAVCTIIDIIRQYLFKCVGVNKLLASIQNIAEKLYEKIKIAVV